jgi:hypothetical protein
MSKQTIKSTNERIDSIESGVASILALLQGKDAATPTATAVDTGSAGFLLPQIRSAAPVILDDETFTSCFTNRLAKAKDKAAKDGVDVCLAWVFSAAKKRDYVMYYTASKMPNSAVKLATIRPDGSAKAEAVGVEGMLKAA